MPGELETTGPSGNRMVPRPWGFGGLWVTVTAGFAGVSFVAVPTVSARPGAAVFRALPFRVRLHQNGHQAGWHELARQRARLCGNHPTSHRDPAGPGTVYRECRA